MKYYPLSILILFVCSASSIHAQQSRIHWVTAGHSGQIQSISIAPNDIFYVTAAYRDRHLIFWNAKSRSFMKWVDLDSTMTCTAISPDSKHIAIGTELGRVYIINASTNAIEFSSLGDTLGAIQLVQFSAGGDSLCWLTSSPFSSVTVLEIASGTQSSQYIQTGLNPQFTPKRTLGENLSLSRDFRKIAYLTTTGYGVYSVTLSKTLFETNSQFFVYTGISFLNHDSDIVVSDVYAGNTDTHNLMDATTGALLLPTPALSTPALYGTESFQAIGSGLLATYTQNFIYILDSHNLNNVATYPNSSNGLTQADFMVWSEDGKCAVGGTSDDYAVVECTSLPQRLYSYDAANGYSEAPLSLLNEDLTEAKYTGKSELYIASSTLNILDTSKNVRQSRYSTIRIPDIAFSHDGKFYASNDVLMNMCVSSALHVYDAASSQRTNDSISPFGFSNGSPTTQLSFSPQDNLLAVGNTIVPFSDTTNVPTWSQRAYVNAFTPDGLYLFAASGDTVERISSATGAVIDRFPSGHGVVRCIAMNNAGAHIATCGDDSTIRVWDANSRTLIKELHGHHGIVTGVKFSPNGAYLVSSSLDSTVRVWNVQTGALVDSFAEWNVPYTGIDISGDGKYILASSLHSVVEYSSSRVTLLTPQIIDQSPVEFAVYPNPSTGDLAIRFSLPSREKVNVRIVNILGEDVAEISNSILSAGPQTFRLSKAETRLTSGAYFCVLTRKEGTAVLPIAMQ